jgi:hypothetical protein
MAPAPVPPAARAAARRATNHVNAPYSTADVHTFSFCTVQSYLSQLFQE